MKFLNEMIQNGFSYVSSSTSSQNLHFKFEKQVISQEVFKKWGQDL